MVDGVLVKEVGRDDCLDDLLHDLASEVFGCDLLGVLSRDDDGVDTDRNDGASSVGVLLVLNGNLSLGLRREKSGYEIRKQRTNGTGDAILTSGRSHPIFSFRRSSAIFLFKPWAKTIVKGMYSSVSL